MGTQQSGVLNLKIADIIKDNDILQHARFYAKKILIKDPALQNPENKALLNTYKQLSKYKNIWNYIS
jgi:ATP-dependent DNA helicase RecG